MLSRFLIFAALWLVLDGVDAMGLVIGLPTAALAAWASLRLLPQGGGRWDAVGMADFVVRLLLDSALSGWDVARRVFDPRLPLRYGVIGVPCAMPEGPRRDFFLAVCGMLPGTLPVEDAEDGKTQLHCLDCSLPIAAQAAAQERRINRALGQAGGRRNA